MSKTPALESLTASPGQLASTASLRRSWPGLAGRSAELDLSALVSPPRHKGRHMTTGCRVRPQQPPVGKGVSLSPLPKTRACACVCLSPLALLAS